MRSRLIPLSMNILQMQTLGLPFFDPRSIMLAFDDDTPVGYVHTTLGPSPDGFNLSSRTGQICFLAVNPECSDPVSVARALLEAAEKYLIDLGVEEIYGGSPRPCAPFYIGFFGGAEAIGFFDSDTHLIRAFHEAGYEVFKNTVRFHLDLRDFKPRITPIVVGLMEKLDIFINDLPKPKTWWEACSFANFSWMEASARLKSNGRPVARIRVRVANPDMEDEDVLYSGTWDAGLMDVRVLPDFHRQGVAAYTLGEMLRYLVMQGQAEQIEAHIAEDSATMYPLLRSLSWREIDTGKIFLKSIR